MSRRALSRKQASVTLFPFLAVLICTMGSLIVLLVVVVQQARQQAPATDIPPPAPAPPSAVEVPSSPDLAAQLATQLEDLQWGNQVLAQSRQQTLQRLEQQRLELSRHEDRTRHLAAQLKLLEQQAENLLATERQRQGPTQPTTSDLADVQSRLEAARQELAMVQDAAEKQRRQYALLPYDGPHGTRRRPIYIECLSDQVLLQPEGVRLVAEDFRDLAPHNPLAAALRATREYLLDAGATEATGEPYPLLVVRPGGARAFSACRNAMRSWDDEYGYELVPDDIELAYPPVDQALAALLTETIERARAAMSPLTGLRPYFEDDSVAYELGDQSGSGLIPTDHAVDGGGRGGALAGPGGLSEPRGERTDSVAHPTGLTQQGPYQAGDGAQAMPPVSRDTQSGSGGPLAGPGGFYAGTRGDSDGGTSGPPGAGGTGGPHAARQASTSPLAESDPDRASVFPGGPGRPDPADNSLLAADGSGGNAAEGSDRFSSTTNSSPGQNGATSGAGAGAGAGAAGGGQGASGGAAAGGPSLMGASPTATASIAQTQGANWALPHAAQGAIGITRPIRVVCSSSGIVLMPESGTARAPQRIAFQSSVREAIQPFVTSIWDVIDSWGIAGPGVYWKPVLQIRVEPGADGPFVEMTQLLENSGLEVQRR